MAPVREYVAPSALSECLDVLGREQGVVVLAGGQSVLPLLKSRELRADVLLDLAKVAELRVREAPETADGPLVLGAMVRYKELLEDPAVAAGWTALADAATAIGDLQVQNRGTLGGNLAFAAPTGDMRPVALCLSAELLVAGPDGERVVPYAEAVAAGQPILSAGELLRAIRLPAPGPRSGSAYSKYGISANGRPVVGVAAAVALDGSGACERARIVVGGISAAPWEAERAAGGLIGASPDADAIAAAAAAAAEDATPIDDFRASAAYRSQLIRIHVERALRRALDRAQEG